MEFSYNKTASQYFVCYKNRVNPSINQFSFMHVIKPSRFLQGTKIESMFAKELQKPNQFYGCQVDFCSVQKPS